MSIVYAAYMNLTQRIAKREAELAAALEPADPCPHCNGTGRKPKPAHDSIVSNGVRITCECGYVLVSYEPGLIPDITWTSEPCPDSIQWLVMQRQREHIEAIHEHVWQSSFLGPDECTVCGEKR